MISPAIQDYTKAIYVLSQAERRCTPSLLAEHLSVTPAAVTRMLKRLQELHLVRYVRNQELGLTPAGEKVALEVIRHHRLLELYLKEALGYSWDEVHSEAEELEHVISPKFAARIESLLGYPERDPHGDPIPDPDGALPSMRDIPLTDLEVGEQAVIRRVLGQDPSHLRDLARVGLIPNALVQVRSAVGPGDAVQLTLDGVHQSVDPSLARRVRVERTESASR